VQLGWTTYHTLRSRGSRAGYPDRTLVRERILFVELKREKTGPTDDQVEWLDKLATAGGEVYLWRPSDLDEIARILTGRLASAPTAKDRAHAADHYRVRALAAAQPLDPRSRPSRHHRKRAADPAHERSRMTTTETELERTVREEDEVHDLDTSDSVTSNDVEKTEEAGQTAAFDKSQYDREDLQIAKIDGQSIDRIAIKFTGEIHLDRSDPSDVALYNELKLGRDVALLVEGRCNKTGAKEPPTAKATSTS
jgi:hypothetical protein